MEDTRNLIDKYKGLENEAIIADLDKSRLPLEIAIENLTHDFNIGTIIRNANAWNVQKVHIIGRKKYNRRGAMVTDKYLHIYHHPHISDFLTTQTGRTLIAIENNTPDAKPLSTATFPPKTTLLFGSESDGISQQLLSAAHATYFIEQLGSTRSINVGCASAVAIYAYCQAARAFKKPSHS